MKTGTMFYNPCTDRVDIRYRNYDTFGGLHCGMTMDVWINGKWIPTRIEYGDDGWYLWGPEFKGIGLDGLKVR